MFPDNTMEVGDMGCYNSSVINAPAESVWAALRDFHDLSWAPEIVQNVERVGAAAGDQVGAKRVLNGVFHETLLTLNDGTRELTYSIDDGPGPVAKGQVDGYVGRISVHPITDTGGTFVEWSSTWTDSKGGVKEFCDPIYKALLTALQRHFERAAV